MSSTPTRAILLATLATLLAGLALFAGGTPAVEPPVPAPAQAAEPALPPELPPLSPELLMSVEAAPTALPEFASCSSKQCWQICPDFGGHYIGGSGPGSCICC